MRSAIFVLFGIASVWGTTENCINKNSSFLLYRKFEAIMVEVYRCYCEENIQMGRIIQRYNYTDTTEICLKATTSVNVNQRHFTTRFNYKFNTPELNKTYHGSIPLYLNKTTGKETNTTVYITLEKYTANVDLTNNRIKLPWGLTCDYTVGNCTDPKNATRGYVWKVIERPSNMESCSNFILLEPNFKLPFQQHLVNVKSQDYLILEHNNTKYVLELQKEQEKCHANISLTNKKELIVSLEPLTATMNFTGPFRWDQSVDILFSDEDRKRAEDLIRTCNNDNAGVTKDEPSEAGDDFEYTSPLFTDTEHLHDLLQKAAYVLYTCLAILLYIIVTILISVYDFLMNYFTFKGENRPLTSFLFQSDINKLYLDSSMMQEDSARQDEDQHHYANIE